MSNTNTGDNPQITHDEYAYFGKAIIATAINLSQKYGSLEAMESRMIEAEKRVKELEELNKNLFSLWQALATTGNLQTGENFYKQYDELKQLLTPKQ